MVLVESIVNECVKHYKKIQKTGKPNPNEWTVISAVVGVFNNSEIKILSLGTGSKCIGKSSMSPKGDIINDSHAEVIARRAFLKYLYLQIIQLNESNKSEMFYRTDNSDIVVQLKDSVKFYFVTSMSPCGDSSIMPKEDGLDGDDDNHGKCLTIKSDVFINELKRGYSDENLSVKKFKSEHIESDKKTEDIHRTGAKCLPDSLIQDPHLPGVLYHNVGAVRTKPGRGDPTLSVSCSDKLARWNAIGWQGALLSLLIKTPIFVEGVICGGNCPFSKESFERAINERIKKQIKIEQSKTSFPDVKDVEKRPCPTSIIWYRGDTKGHEVSTNGRKHGVTKKNLDQKSARTSICKKELFILFEKAVNSFTNNKKFIENLLSHSNATSFKDITYGELKLKAEEYQRNWEFVKNEYFKVWSTKPADLLNFTLKDY